jgi:hypothetical protein
LPLNNNNNNINESNNNNDNDDDDDDTLNPVEFPYLDSRLEAQKNPTKDEFEFLGFKRIEADA